ncbi:MAG: terpene cyclase/mutase family protein [Kiritimatiellia bacterium]|jgi:hypothetical protein|nr:terpene cyclase/mutase family protein [Kiritimatiellia bacterium]
MLKSTPILILLLFCVTLHANEDTGVTISPEVERAVERGLAALAKEQKVDGSWDGSYGRNVGETSLCIMAFMSTGNLPGEGQYGETVARALNWVIKQAKPSGLIEYDKQTKRAAVMYGHALSTLMLSEVWGQTRRQDVGKVLRNAVKLILQVQGPAGGWGYKTKPEDGDTSVCVMQMFALKSAHEAGIHVPSAVITKALDLVKKRLNEKSNKFGYTHPGDAYMDRWGSSAAGTCIMHICNEKDPKYVKEPRLKLTELMETNKSNHHLYYFTYYGSVSCYYAGGEEYRAWKQVMEPRILEAQRKNGDWGARYQTAFAVLALALPYRYIPIYQH